MPKITNYEKIKNMDITEMIDFLDKMNSCKVCIYKNEDCSFGACKKGIEAWLKEAYENWNNNI